MSKILCWLFGHKRHNTWCEANGHTFTWSIECKRCGYKIKYNSPWARLTGVEIQHGFTGE